MVSDLFQQRFQQIFVSWFYFLWVDILSQFCVYHGSI
uniref:Uncharacterized protein n=1 Tax=Rhizophora mucronata TaxID=61149 RepID=A0A2P2QUJ0_RHIMU